MSGPVEAEKAGADAPAFVRFEGGSGGLVRRPELGSFGRRLVDEAGRMRT